MKKNLYVFKTIIGAIICFIIATLSQYESNAQLLNTDDFGKEKRQNATTRGSLYFINGFQFLNPVSFNEKISSSGYPALKAIFGSGFGGYGESLHWVIGGEGSYIQRAKNNNSKTTQSYGGLGYFFLGYKITNNNRWKIFPALGVGLGGVTNSLTTKVSTGTSFDEILNAKPNAQVFSNGSVFLHGALSVEYKFYKYYFVGMKGGYNLSLLGKTNWVAPGLDQNLTVKDSFGGLYLNAQVGFYLR